MSTATLLLLPFLLAPSQEARVPGEVWMRYADPAEAGFSSAALAKAREAWEASDSAAFMIVDRGVVVAAWGDVSRRYMCHSTRKSLLSGLIGIHVAAGSLNLEATLAELNIDDQEPSLTREEREARVIDLLRARSGVYRLAAYEPPQNPKPPRGSHAPGTNWCYNNWDFNTLLTIFEQETGTKIFEEFDRAFAKPLGMQDYRVRDGYYHYERDKSMHPAYPFRMSARDMARFGLLYLNEGVWGEERILESDWVADSRTSYSDSWMGGYGYMWWTLSDPRFGPSGLYAALGVGGQMIAVVPDHGLVCVNRTNTYLGRRVPNDTLTELVAAAIEARVGESDAEPVLVALSDSTGQEPAGEPGSMERFVGSYSIPRYGEDEDRVEVRIDEGRLLLNVSFMGTYALGPRDVEAGIFFVEDLNMHARLQPGGEGQAGTADLEWFMLREANQLIESGALDEARMRAELAAEMFPESAWGLYVLSMAFRASGEMEFASDLAQGALELFPPAPEISEYALSLRDG